MRGEWREIRLGDLVTDGVLVISDGYRVRNEELGPQGIPFVRGGDIGDGWINTATTDHIRPELAHRVATKLALPGDVAFITKGTVGRAGRLRAGQPPVVFAPQVAYWRVRDPKVLDSGFLFYLIRSREFQGALHGVKTHGSMVADYVSISQQHDFSFRIPDVESQRAIARVLCVLDDKIDLNRRMNRTLEEMAQAIFKSWFVDFDGQTEFVDSGTELEEIPAGWSVEPIGEVIDAVGGSTPSTKVNKYWEGGTIHWTTPKDLSSLSSPVLLDTERKITEAGLSKISSGLLPVGTILMSSRAPVGYLAVSQVPIGVNQGYIAIPPGGRLSSLYLLHWLKTNMERIKARAGGTTFQEISKRNFRPIPALVPPREAVRRFDDVAGPLYERIVCNERQSRTLAELRDTLLPKLISGEIRVPEAESSVENAL